MISVIPTDTVYGMVAPAHDKISVEKIYEIKRRNNSKPLIILIDSIDQIDQFGVIATDKINQICDAQWPGPVSIILPARNASEYLHRGTKSLAFRLPANEQLREFIKENGPIVAPSANPEGKPPATTVEEARAYFGDQVDEYIDGGVRDGKPSRVIRISEDGEVEVLRD